MTKKVTNLIVIISIVVVLLVGIIVAVVLTNKPDQKDYEYETEDFLFSRRDGEIKVVKFKNTSAKKTITIPDEVDGFKVTSIGDNAFKGDETLQVVTVSDNIKSVGASAFADMPKLESILMKNVESIGDEAFMNCTSLATFNMPASLKTIGTKAFYGCSSINKFIYGYDDNFKPMLSITSIGEEAFAGTRLDVIMVPSSLETIGPKAFMNAGIEKAIFFEGVKNIGDDAFAFKNNSGRSLSIYTYDETKAKNAKTNGEDIVLSNYHIICNQQLPASIETIGNRAFKKGDLEASGRVYLPNLKFGNNLKSIGDEAFVGAYLDDLSFANPNTCIGKYAFSMGSGTIHDVALPTGMTVIPEGLFLMTPINSPHGIEIPANVSEIGIGAFSGLRYRVQLSFKADSIAASKYDYVSGTGYSCLTSKDGTILYSMIMGSSDSYVIPDTINVIEKYAFASLGSYLSNTDDINVTIPSSVREIKAGAFTDSHITNFNLAHDNAENIVIASGAFDHLRTKEDYIIRVHKSADIYETIFAQFKDNNKVSITSY